MRPVLVLPLAWLLAAAHAVPPHSLPSVPWPRSLEITAREFPGFASARGPELIVANSSEQDADEQAKALGLTARQRAEVIKEDTAFGFIEAVGEKFTIADGHEAVYGARVFRHNDGARAYSESTAYWIRRNRETRGAIVIARHVSGVRRSVALFVAYPGGAGADDILFTVGRCSFLTADSIPRPREESESAMAPVTLARRLARRFLGPCSP